MLKECLLRSFPGDQHSIDIQDRTCRWEYGPPFTSFRGSIIDPYAPLESSDEISTTMWLSGQVSTGVGPDLEANSPLIPIHSEVVPHSPSIYSHPG